MGKKTAAAAKRNGNRNIADVRNNGTIIRKNSTAQGRNGIQSKANEALSADNSSEEEPQVSTSAAESPNGDASDSVDSEEGDGPEVSMSDGDDEAEDEPPPTKIVKKGKVRVEDDNDDEDEETERKRESVLYRFPMNRVKSIIKEEIPDLRISPEAVFLINRASEKFLQLFSKEAYACAFLDRKNHTSYHHLSSIVTKRKRFSFLSDFVPEMLKGADAVADDAEK